MITTRTNPIRVSGLARRTRKSPRKYSRNTAARVFDDSDGGWAGRVRPSGLFDATLSPLHPRIEDPVQHVRNQVRDDDGDREDDDHADRPIEIVPRNRIEGIGADPGPL